MTSSGNFSISLGKSIFSSFVSRSSLSRGARANIEMKVKRTKDVGERRSPVCLSVCLSIGIPTERDRSLRNARNLADTYLENLDFIPKFEHGGIY